MGRAFFFEGWAMCGLGGEIAQGINELAFDDLDAPAPVAPSPAKSDEDT